MGNLPINREMRGNRGYCHIQFANQDQMETAMNQSNCELDGRVLRMDLAKGRRKTNYSRGGMGQ